MLRQSRMLQKSTFVFIFIEQFLQPADQSVRSTVIRLSETRLIGLLQALLQILKVFPGKGILGEQGQHLFDRVDQFLVVFPFEPYAKLKIDFGWLNAAHPVDANNSQ